MRETAVGPWILFDFGPEEWRSVYRYPHGLYWAGCACFRHREKIWAGTLFRRAEQRLDANPDDPEALAMLVEAAGIVPGTVAVTGRLIDRARATGRADLVDRWQAVQERYVPSEVMPVRFGNGIEFLGLDIESSAIQAGGSVRVRYFWRCPPNVDPETLAVFVHLQHEQGRFQDDHVLLEDVNVEDQPFPAVFIEERTVTVPRDVPAGELEVRLGIYNRVNGHRQSAICDFPVARHAVSLPVKLSVTE